MKVFLALAFLAVVVTVESSTNRTHSNAWSYIFNSLVNGQCPIHGQAKVNENFNSNLDHEPLRNYVAALLNVINQGLAENALFNSNLSSNLKELESQLKAQRFRKEVETTEASVLRLLEKGENMIESHTELQAEQICHVVRSIVSQKKPTTPEEKKLLQAITQLEAYDAAIEEMYHNIYAYIYEVYLAFLEKTGSHNATNLRQHLKISVEQSEQIDSEEELEAALTQLENQITADKNALREDIERLKGPAKEIASEFEDLLSIFTTGDFLSTCDVQEEFQSQRLALADKLHLVKRKLDFFFEAIEEAMEAGSQTGQAYISIIQVSEQNGELNVELDPNPEDDLKKDLSAIAALSHDELFENVDTPVGHKGVDHSAHLVKRMHGASKLPKAQGKHQHHRA